jgi:hypothetical protein
MSRIFNHTSALLLFLSLCCGALAADNLPIVLLGMSFLNRMEMKRDGEKMTLTKKY